MARILVIEDEALMRKAIAISLQRAGHVVVTADNGKHGVNLYMETRPDLVLTDLMMPEKDGVETIIEIRRADPSAKIIAMSGAALGAEVFLPAAKTLGAIRILSKPLDATQIVQTVAQVLAQQDGGAPAAPASP
ncbi:MAG: response regulator [Opitutae bacterium]|nr:response regulator [Opitutae bacterium]